MLRKLSQELLLDVVRNQTAIISTRRHLRSIIIEHNRPRLIFVLLTRHDTRTLRDVPELDCVVAGATGKVQAIGMCCYTQNPRFMARKCFNQVPRTHLVQMYLHVVTGCENLLRVCTQHALSAG